MSNGPHMIITADGRRAALFSCQNLPSGGVHLESVKSIQNEHENEHERGRPTLVGGAERRSGISRSGARPGPHSVAEDRTGEEEIRRFAREVRKWLTTSRELDGRPTTLFAPARFLGLLREELRGVNHKADLREGELGHLRPHELAVHPAVLGAIAGTT
jgi:hypothetical protein